MQGELITTVNSLSSQTETGNSSASSSQKKYGRNNFYKSKSEPDGMTLQHGKGVKSSSFIVAQIFFEEKTKPLPPPADSMESLKKKFKDRRTSVQLSDSSHRFPTSKRSVLSEEKPKNSYGLLGTPRDRSSVQLPESSLRFLADEKSVIFEEELSLNELTELSSDSTFSAKAHKDVYQYITQGMDTFDLAPPAKRRNMDYFVSSTESKKSSSKKIAIPKIQKAQSFQIQRSEKDYDENKRPATSRESFLKPKTAPKEYRNSIGKLFSDKYSEQKYHFNRKRVIKKISKVIHNSQERKENHGDHCCANKIDLALEEFKKNEIGSKRLSFKYSPEAITCEQLQEKEYPLAGNIAQNIASHPLLFKKALEMIRSAKEMIEKKFNEMARNVGFTNSVLELLEELIKNGNNLQAFLQVLKNGLTDPEVKNIIYQILVGKKNLQEAEKLIAVWEKWSRYSILSAFKELHRLNWDEIMKKRITDQTYTFSDEMTEDKIFNGIKISDIVKGYLFHHCETPVIYSVTVNNTEIPLDDLKGTIRERQFELLRRIISAIYEEGFSTHLQDLSIAKQITRLIDWKEAIVIDELDMEKINAERRRLIGETLELPKIKEKGKEKEAKTQLDPPVWTTLPYEKFLKMGIVNTRLIFRNYLTLIFPSFFSDELSIKFDKGIYLHIQIDKEKKLHSASQIIKFIFHNKYQQEPLGHLNIEWTIFVEENDQNNITKGIFKILDYSFTEAIEEEEKEQILLELFRLLESESSKQGEGK